MKRDTTTTPSESDSSVVDTRSSKKQHSDMAALNAMATTLKALHKPGAPIVFANVYDTVSARAVSSLSSCRALATASYAVAKAANVEDDDLDMATNLAAARLVGAVAREKEIPLTVDLQDGYGDKLEEAISQVIDAGAVGINLEDVDKDTQKFHSPEVAAERVRRTLRVAKDKGVPDFVVNARTDALVHGRKIEEAIERGKLFLEAGATTVFVWGGGVRGGITKEEVQQLCKAFNGRLNVSMKLPEGAGLTVKELAEIGVARISVGPALQFIAMDAYKKEAEKFLK